MVQARANTQASQPARRRESRLAWIGFLFALLVRVCIAAGGHSGQNDAPRYGDFEAQRHWMEITVQQPLQQWYRVSEDWWRLDYPPLSAFFAYLLGCLFDAFEATRFFVAWETSRGADTPETRALMRLSVLVADLVVMMTGLYAFSKSSNSSSKNINTWATLLALVSPPLLLIDHGHFQYNCVALGLMVWAAWCLRTDTARQIDQQTQRTGQRKSHRDLPLMCLGAACFAAALLFKQMLLHVALPFFVLLLSRCFHRRSFADGVTRLTAVGATVIVVFVVSFWPWLRADWHVFKQSFRAEGAGQHVSLSESQVAQVLRRLFPFWRGLYEDKVANFWCSSNLVIKWRERFDKAVLRQLSTGATLVFSLPSLLPLWRSPTTHHFLHSLLATSLAFFLFGYHVHEKTVLIAVTCAHLLLLSRSTHATLRRWLAQCLLPAAALSLFPLLRRDGQFYGYLGSLLVLAALLLLSPYRRTWVDYAVWSACSAVHLYDWLAPVSPRFPHIALYLFSLVPFAVLAATWLLTTLLVCAPSSKVTRLVLTLLESGSGSASSERKLQ
ncbi:MAG: hypothetical protein MHM6MM_004445 [Cercozoa sp. M6MM]